MRAGRTKATAATRHATKGAVLEPARLSSLMADWGRAGGPPFCTAARTREVWLYAHIRVAVLQHINMNLKERTEQTASRRDLAIQLHEQSACRLAFLKPLRRARMLRRGNCGRSEDRRVGKEG